MGKKKQIEGNVFSVEMPPDEPVKKKREMSEKQLENLKKGMAVLKARREAKSKKDETEEQAPPPVAPVASPVAVAPPAPVAAPAPAPEVKKERKPRVVKNYLTTDDFNNFRNELFTTLKKPEPTTPQQPVVRDVVKEVLKEVPLAQSVVVKERVITGRELLDKIFFN